MVPPSARRAKRPPVTIEALSILFDNLSFSDPFDCIINANIPQDAPLFKYRTSTNWSLLTRQVFISRCHNLWTVQGFLPMPGHAFRISRATELLLQDVHPDVVSSQGRWTSDSFLEYWRRIETILPFFISSSVNNDRFSNLDTVMDSDAQQHHNNIVPHVLPSLPKHFFPTFFFYATRTFIPANQNSSLTRLHL
ncbi:hypothetical protein EV702DRAFT_1094731 [Suillus placidus]|uniref:Uncharacterized protein n=1 Tax=Suillus placidus TaxID=48579 RepID=A0A9P6ZFN5_9AGAM|nr:hypothetical protein EV702DRAFT_1174083 [Suillus placidus]KAG1778206.1 hypothetical protein EV702DRAFT_1094731 [Suillus placidus]